MEHAWQLRGDFGGNRFLDFLNTVNDEGKTREENALPDWPTALEWGLGHQLLTTSEAREIGGVSREMAQGALERLLRFRERTWGELSGLANGSAADPVAVERMGKTILECLSQASLVRDGRQFRWRVAVGDYGVEVFRARLATDFWVLSTTGELPRLRECGRCTGLFLDHGRGSGRRWCRMEVCGNRSKLERFRKKA